MQEQPLDLKTAIQVVRRHRLLVIVVAAIGLAAGIGYAFVKPPLYTSDALVVLSASAHDTPTELVIAKSDPVLVGAHLDGVSIEALRSRVRPKSLAYNLITISAKGKTSGEAETTANAVSRSYVRYLQSGNLPGGAIEAHVLQPATDASGGSPLVLRLLVAGGVGAVLAASVGAIAALALGRSDRRLRQRDDISQCARAPVLASMSMGHPTHVNEWKALLDAPPGSIDNVRLRKALENLDLLGPRARGSSLAVVSLSCDPKAVTVGPRLAALTAALGVPTALVIGPQRNTAARAALQAAGTALSSHSALQRNLRLIGADHSSNARRWSTLLAVMVVVVDEKSPQVASMTDTTATVLGITSGATSADHCRRVIHEVALAGRALDGVIVVDPDPADPTTGRFPRWATTTARPVSEQSG